MRRLTQRPSILLLLALWAAAAVAFGVADLAISTSLADPQSGWAHFGARWGELPGLVVILAALLVIARQRRSLSSARLLLVRCGLGALAASAVLPGLLRVARNLGGAAAFDRWVAPGIAISLGVGLVLVFAASARARDSSRHARQFARAAVALALANVVLFVGLVKPLWGRTRPRDLDAESLAFSPWFVPQGVTGHVSFPSGHTAMGWMLLPLALLVARHRPVRRAAVLVVAVGWGAFVAASRVRLGAHYPSDVLFPTGVAWLVFLLCLAEKRAELDEVAP